VALEHRLETLKREAHDKLKIGTKKSDVVRFFEQNGIPLTIDQESMRGSISALGCSSPGCWDAAEIRIKVELDESGNAKSEPIVNGIFYPDCM
jgi:hypothetical protein